MPAARHPAFRLRFPGLPLAGAHLAGALLAAALLAMARPASAQLAPPWWAETVDASGDVGYFTSLARDGRGRAHIAYADFGRAALKYAVQGATGWDTVTVHALAGQTGWLSAIGLALDRDGQPRIAYQDERRGDLRFARTVDGAWRHEPVDTAGVVGAHLALAVDDAGDAHVSYYDEDRRALRYAWQTAGVWHTEVADSSGDFAARSVGQYTAIAIDPAAEPHIAYYDAANGDLKYATRHAGAWQIEVLDFLGDVGRYCAIALDAQGLAAIAYTDFANVSTSPGPTARAAHGKHVKYARQTEDGWQVDIADAIGLGSQYVSLALDARGLERIVYYDFFELRVKYAIDTGDGWDVQYPGLPELVGNFPSIALDGTDLPHVAYLDASGAQGRLAYMSQGLHVAEPAPAARWSPGDSAWVRWRGTGDVTIDLSADDGASWVTLATEVTGGAARVAVPTLTSRRARIRLTRAHPFAQVTGDSVFALGAGEAPVLRVRRAAAGANGDVPDVVFTPPAAFAPGNDATWSLHDPTGRRVRHGRLPGLVPGVPRTVTWDGRRDDGRAAARGAYLLRVRWPGGTAAIRLPLLSRVTGGPTR